MVQPDYEALYQAGLRQRRLARQQPVVAGFTGTSGADTASLRSEPEPGIGLAFGAIANKFREVVPQPVRDAIGFGWGIVDTPISQRLGFNLEDSPERPGPGNEIENVAKAAARVLIEEPTRPTNYLVALRGASVASKLGKLGKVGRAVGSLVEPISRGSSAQRVAAEVAVSGLARGGAEAANAALPENTPAPVRIAVGLGAGLLSGTAGARGLSGISRGTLGSDILGIVPQPVRITGTKETETMPRIGKFLQARAPEELADVGVRDLTGGGLRGAEGELSRLRRVATSQANLVRGSADSMLTQLGKREYYKVASDGSLASVKRASDGNAHIRDAAGNPQMLQRVLQFPGEYNLTPAQRAAILRFQNLVASVYDEAHSFGVAPELTDVGIDGSYVPRLAIENSKGEDLEIGVFGVGGGLTGGPAYKSRQHLDPLRAAMDGVVYADPEVALDRYTGALFKKSIDSYAATLFKMRGGSAADRINQAFVDATNVVRSKVRVARTTVINQRARAATLESQAERDIAAAQRATGRAEAAGGRVGERAAQVPTAEEVVAQRARTSGLITEGNELARKAQRNIDTLRPLERRLDLNEQRITAQIDALQKQIEAASELPEEAIGDAAIGRLERSVERLAKLNDGLEERVDFRINQGQLLSEKSTLQRAELVESRRAERQQAWAERNLAVAERELRQLEREAARADTRAAASGERAARAAGARAASGQKYDALRDELAVMRAKLADIRERAEATPLGRARVDLARAPLLRGVDFDPKDAKRIEEFYAGSMPETTQIGKSFKKIRQFNGVMVPIRAVGDMSSVLNQIGFMAFSHPIQFTKNFGVALRDMINPTAYEKYVLDNDYAVSRGVAAMGEAGKLSDFEFGSWADRWPVLSNLQRHFRVFSTRNRIDMFNSLTETARKSGQPLSRLDEEQLARGVNRLTGVSTSRAGDLETAVSFAPTFLRSGIETVVKAAMDGSIEGQVARQYLRNMLVSGQMLAFTTAVLQGRDPTEVTHPFDRKALERGEIRLNSNFGTVRFGGQDISLYGRWDSLARLGVAGMDGVTRSISTQDLHPLMDAAGLSLTSKGSPLLQAAASAAAGVTYEGNDPTSVPGALELTLPFTFSAFVSDIYNDTPVGEAAAGAAFNWFGGKARELTPFEKMNNVAIGTYGKSLDELTGVQRQQLEAQNPELAEASFRQTERLAAKGDNKSEARLQRGDADARRLRDEGLLYAKYQSGEITVKQFSDALSDTQKRAVAEKEQIDRTLGVEHPESEGAQRAVSDWYGTYDKAEIAPGVIDYDLRDQLEADLFARVRRGEYGAPVTAQAAIDGRKQTEHVPGVARFYAMKDYIRESGYYDLKDAAFTRVAELASRIASKPLTSYGALTREMQFARARGDRVMYRRLNNIQNRIDHQAEPRQKMLRLRDPKLDEALVGAQGLVPVRQQAR